MSKKRIPYTCRKCGHQGYTDEPKDPDIFGTTIIDQQISWHDYDLLIPAGVRVKKMPDNAIYWVEDLPKVIVLPDGDSATVSTTIGSTNVKGHKYGILIHDATYYGITVKAETVKQIGV
jgi:hypothetical protein